MSAHCLLLYSATKNAAQYLAKPVPGQVINLVVAGAVRPAIEKLGGKIESAWYAFGDYDVVLIVQMPSNVDAGAIAIAFAAGGACKAVKTTPLLTAEEAVEAMKKASGSEYRAPH